MFASRFVVGAIGVVMAACVGCGGDSQVPSDQRALEDEITSLGGLCFVDKKAPDQGIYSINLKGTKADDALVAKFPDLPALKYLNLNGAPVTNASAESFKKMKSLERLDIGNTKISLETLEDIRTAKPNLEISWNVPETPPEPGIADFPPVE